MTVFYILAAVGGIFALLVIGAALCFLWLSLQDWSH